MSNRTANPVVGSKAAALRSVTYLAYGHNGRNGLDPQTVKWSMACWAAYKKNFVKFMVEKKIMSEEEASRKNDEFMMAYYKNEVRAFEEPTKGRFIEREPGAYEMGDYEAFFANRKDEVTRDPYGWDLINAKVRTPDSRKDKNFKQLKQYVLFGGAKKLNRIQLNARVLLRNGAITKDHWNQLNELIAVMRKCKRNNYK